MNPPAPENIATGTGSRTHIPVVWLLAALFAIYIWRVWFAACVNLIPDECSYWAWSRRLDWSYFDNSGMVAYLIRISTVLFGESSPFSVRFPFLLLSVLSTYLIYSVGRHLFGDARQALLSSVLLNLTPVALLGGGTAIHDNVLLFSWLLTVWAAARFIKTGRMGWFYIMGIGAGLAVQSKYTGVLLVPALFLFLLWCGQYRRLLLCKEPWIGVLIASAFALPIVWWNWQHDWASVNHILFIGGGSASVAKRIADGVGYHLAQILLVSPLLYFALLAGLTSALGSNLLKPDPPQAILLCFGLPLVLFGLQAFGGHVEANWAFTGYASTAVLAVHVIISKRAADSGAIWKWFNGRFLEWAVILAVAPVIVVALHAWLGLLPAWVEKKIAKEDRIVWETRGWAGLGKHVGGLLRAGDVIAADTYQLCALLEFNVPGQPQVRYLAPWKRPTQFDVWEPSFDNLQGRSIIFVSALPLRPSSTALTTIYENFASVETLAPYEVMYHGTEIRTIYLYRGHSFDPFHPRRLGPRSLFYRDY